MYYTRRHASRSPFYSPFYVLSFQGTTFVDATQRASLRLPGLWCRDLSRVSRAMNGNTHSHRGHVANRIDDSFDHLKVYFENSPYSIVRRMEYGPSRATRIRRFVSPRRASLDVANAAACFELQREPVRIISRLHLESRRRRLKPRSHVRRDHGASERRFRRDPAV